MVKFSPNGGHFGYPDFSKYVFSNVFLYYVCRKDFWRNNYLFHGIIVEKWPFLWNFELFWAILGRFEPFVGTQNFWIVVPCIIYPLMTFSQQLSGINIVFHAFFKSFDSQTMIFGLKWGFLGVFEGPTFIGTKNQPENTWNMFIGSICDPLLAAFPHKHT